MKKNRRIVMPLLVFILVIGGWELYVRVFDISLYILPSPSKIISALIENFDIHFILSLLACYIYFQKQITYLYEGVKCACLFVFCVRFLIYSFR